MSFCKQHALPLRCAMHCDINGWPWALADILAEHNIPFFCSQVHIDSATDPLGQRGSVHYHWVLEQGADLRPDVPIRIRQAFWWQGPAAAGAALAQRASICRATCSAFPASAVGRADKTRYFLETDHMTPMSSTPSPSASCRAISRLHAGGYSASCC